MARLSKEDEAYLWGLNRALELVQAGGVQMLEKEVEWRGQVSGVPVGVTQAVLTALARGMIKPELRVISTALAYTLEFELKLPSRTIGKFLYIFNNRMDEYRVSSAKLEYDSKQLDYDYGLTKQVNDWYQMACARDEDLPKKEESEGEDYNDEF